jgi:hypothetical protein
LGDARDRFPSEKEIRGEVIVPLSATTALTDRRQEDSA